MPRSPPPRADTNQKTRTRKDGENNPPRGSVPSRGLAEVALGRRNLQPLLASAAQPATASPLSENLRRYEKYGLSDWNNSEIGESWRVLS